MHGNQADLLKWSTGQSGSAMQGNSGWLEGTAANPSSPLWADRMNLSAPEQSGSMRIGCRAQTSTLITAKSSGLTCLHPARVKCHNGELLLQQVI